MSAELGRAAVIDLLDQLDLYNKGERRWNEVWPWVQQYRRQFEAPLLKRPIDQFFDDDAAEHNDGSEGA